LILFIENGSRCVSVEIVFNSNRNSLLNSVIQLPSGSFKSPGDAAEFYLDKLERGGAKKTRPFQVDLVSYSPC
jgi:hypothetical protein